LAGGGRAETSIQHLLHNGNKIDYQGVLSQNPKEFN
jgi:hypothetical protein